MSAKGRRSKPREEISRGRGIDNITSFDSDYRRFVDGHNIRHAVCPCQPSQRILSSSTRLSSSTQVRLMIDSHLRARNLIIAGSLGGPISGPNIEQPRGTPSLSVQPPEQDGCWGLSFVVMQLPWVAPRQPHSMYPPVSPFSS